MSGRAAGRLLRARACLPLGAQAAAVSAVTSLGANASTYGKGDEPSAEGGTGYAADHVNGDSGADLQEQRTGLAAAGSASWKLGRRMHAKSV